MPSRYPLFDRSRLKLLPLAQRGDDVHIPDLLTPGGPAPSYQHPDLPAVADAIAAARSRGSAVVLMMGAHVIKRGCGPLVIDMIRKGWISAVAANGACVVHDYELARFGGTSENVSKYISQGQFGLWQETSELNDVIRRGSSEGLGLGEAAGRHILDSGCPHRNSSVFAAAYEAGVPATVHVAIGQDILHEHPNCDGAAIGDTSYRDFLIFARVIESLEGGVLLSFGSAVMAPEVYLKALSMARNVAHQQDRRITAITSAVFDLVELEGDIHREPSPTGPGFYYRPHKTILIRTVRDGGRSFYFRGEHRATMSALWRLLQERGPSATGGDSSRGQGNTP